VILRVERLAIYVRLQDLKYFYFVNLWTIMTEQIELLATLEGEAADLLIYVLATLILWFFIHANCSRLSCKLYTWHLDTPFLYKLNKTIKRSRDVSTYMYIQCIE
jgi:hypothetical protein